MRQRLAHLQVCTQSVRSCLSKHQASAVLLSDALNARHSECAVPSTGVGDDTGGERHHGQQKRRNSSDRRPTDAGTREPRTTQDRRHLGGRHRGGMVAILPFRTPCRWVISSRLSCSWRRGGRPGHRLRRQGGPQEVPGGHSVQGLRFAESILSDLIVELLDRRSDRCGTRSEPGTLHLLDVPDPRPRDHWTCDHDRPDLPDRDSCGPTRHRVRDVPDPHALLGVSSGCQITLIAAGPPAPIIATAPLQRHRSLLSVAIYIVIDCAVTDVTVLSLREARGLSLRMSTRRMLRRRF